MISLFTHYSQIVKKKPQLLSENAYKLIHSAAKEHHQLNKLLPSSDIKHFINILTQSKLTTTNDDTACHLLAAFSISLILKVNFGQLSENKLYSTVVFHYGQVIQEIIEKLRERQLNNFIYSKLIARGIVQTKIIQKVTQRTKAFLPQFFRFATIALNILQQLIRNQNFEQSSLSNKVPNQSILLRICFSKKVTKQNFLHLLHHLKCLVFSQNASCPSSSHISAVQKLKQEFQRIRLTLPEHEQHFLQENDREQHQNSSNIYLQEPLKVRELTPRMYNQEKSVQLSKLRRKKLRLKKKIELDFKKNVQMKQQQINAIEEVRRQRGKHRQKKEQFVLEKQTAEAKKYHKRQKKVKLIKKSHDKGTDKDRLKKLSLNRRKK